MAIIQIIDQNKLIVKNAPGDSAMSIAPNFISYSALGSSLYSTTSDLLGDDPLNPTFPFFSMINAFGIVGDFLFVSGEKWGTGDMFRPVIKQSTGSAYALDHTTNGTTNFAGVSGNAKRTFGFESFHLEALRHIFLYPLSHKFSKNALLDNL